MFEIRDGVQKCVKNFHFDGPCKLWGGKHECSLSNICMEDKTYYTESDGQTTSYRYVPNQSVADIAL